MRKNLTLSSPESGGQPSENTLSSDLQKQTQRAVIGLGNPILGDDGFGWVVAEQIRQNIDQQLTCVDVECFALGGLSLMERLIGYDEAILIDAIQLGGLPVGTLQTLLLEDIPDHVVGHLYSSHDTSLKNAIKMGESLGAHLPQRITIVGVETSSVYDFSEELSEPVKSAVPLAVQTVLKLLDNKDLSIP